MGGETGVANGGAGTGEGVEEGLACSGPVVAATCAERNGSRAWTYGTCWLIWRAPLALGHIER